MRWKAWWSKYLLKFLYGTCVWEVSGRNQIKELTGSGKSVIIAIWHGKVLPIFMDLASYHYYALAGMHKDAELISQIDSTDWIKELSGPERNLLVQVIEYFQKFPNGQVADLLSSLDNDSASFIGSLLSGSPSLDKKNSVAYFQDCLSALKKANPRKRIIELKKQLAKEKLSEDETFELQQHLLSNLEKLNEEDRGLLRELSQN